jgi:hypothetical protein
MNAAKEISMKKKLIFPAMPLALLALGLALVGCSTDSDDGGKVPVALQGNWLRDSGGTERYLRFNDSRWEREDSGPVSDAYINGGWVVTSGAGNKIEYQHEWYPDFDVKGSFEWAVSADGNTLTISNSDHEGYLSNGTYTKLP